LVSQATSWGIWERLLGALATWVVPPLTFDNNVYVATPLAPICIEMFVERQLLHMMVRLDQSGNVYWLDGLNDQHHTFDLPTARN
jgi:hypothetical protein